MEQTVWENTTGLPDIHNRDTRSRLARMTMQLFDHWRLPTEDKCALLGLTPGSRTSMNRYRQGAPFADNRDLLGRVGHLMGIHKSLRIIFPHDQDLAYRWVTQPNQVFNGRRPLDIMKEGYEGVLVIRRYLDFERGR